jgi:hypothetical protein
MSGDPESSLIPSERILERIYLIRERKVMLDRDLAKLYGVKTKALKQAVRRNARRFPHDFMFELTKEEFENWRSQFVTSNGDKMGLRYRPMAFTEQGVAMLSSVLNSERAIQVNIVIMRVFTRFREMLETHEALRRKLEAMEKRYDKQFRVVFDAIRSLLDAEGKPKRKIGFEVKESRAAYGKGKKSKSVASR